MADEFDPEAFISDVPVIPADAVRPTTYGPGSPSPTPADLREFIGDADNPLKKGDVALQPETAREFGLKHGDQFKYKGKIFTYADTPNPRVGAVIDVYHPPKEGGGFDPEAFISGKAKPETTTIESRIENRPDSGGFNPLAFIEGEEPISAQAPESKDESGKRRGGGAPAATPSAAPEPIKVSIPTVNQPFEIPAGGPNPAIAGVGESIPVPPQSNYFLAKAGVQPSEAMSPEVRKFAETPLLPPEIARPIVQAVSTGASVINPAMAIEMEALRRLYPEAVNGLTDSAAEQVSGITSPAALAALPAMMVPGVAEAWGADQLAQTPEHWGNVKQTIDRYGLGSRESVKALSNETARLTMATGAVAGRALMKGKQPAKSPTGNLETSVFPQNTETGWVDNSGNVVDLGTGTRESPPQLLKRKEIAKGIAQKHDSVFTRADYDSRQKANGLRQEFGWRFGKWLRKSANNAAKRDLDAATFIEEAQRNKVALKADLELVRSSKSAKLARKYVPILEHALKNFDRLSKPNSYAQLMRDQMVEDAAAGISYGEQKSYVTHVLKNEPESSLLSFFTRGGSGGGLSKYFTKHREFNTLAEAINAGIEPASVNLADLAQHRIAASRRLILQKAMFNELRNMQGPDGRPAIAPPGDVPQGYERVTANGVDVNVHPDYTGIFRALYGDSAFRRTAKGRALIRTVGVQKAYTLAADTFHGFRGLQKGLFYGGKGSRLGYNRGTTVYELSDAALDKAVESGDISRSQAHWAKNARPAIEAMMKEGMNVSRFADNIVGQMHVSFPGTRGLNDWIFKRVFRGAMLQAAHANFLRNTSRFPELSPAEVARKTSGEMNEVFGNMMNQGLFKDKTIRDALNVTLLAPQWIESQARAEFRGYGQAAKVIPDALRGKFRVGVVAQGQITSVTAFLVANQIINYATTGHSTFQNPEGHRLAAYLPIGRGIYLDPLALSAEYVGRFMDILHRQGDRATIPGVLTEMGRGKLSNIGRAGAVLVTQRDWRGRQLQGADLYKAMASELVPLPIAASAAVQKDPSAPLGFTVGAEPDRVTQQVLQSLGLRASLDRPQVQVPMRPPPTGKHGIRGSVRGIGIRGKVR